MDKFQIEERALELQLFVPEDPKIGPYTTLNVNYLPHLAAHILRKLSHKERCSIVEFELQTSILELALVQHKFKNLKDISNHITREMRLSTKFWIHSSEAWNEAQLRLKLYHVLLPNCKEDALKKCGGKRSLPEVLADPVALRKYISQLDFTKLDYKSEFMRIQEVFDLVVQYDQANSQNKQLQAIESYVQVCNTLGYIKQRKYEYKLAKKIEQVHTRTIDLYSRITEPIAKETRQTKGDQTSHREIRALLKEQQKYEVEEKKTIFIPNSVFKYQKIDIIILPYIYQFIFRDSKEFNKNHLKIQNLILYLSLSDQEIYKCNKQKRNILKCDESKTAQKLFQKYLDTSKDKIIIDFDSYCASQNISLASYFSSTPSTYRRELLLIRNILILAMEYAKQLFNIGYAQQTESIMEDLEEYEEEEKQQQRSIKSYQKWKEEVKYDYQYYQVLSQLELYYNIPSDQYETLLKIYKNSVEVLYTSKKEHIKEYFGILKNATQMADNIMFGLKPVQLPRRSQSVQAPPAPPPSSIQEQIDKAVESYLAYINAPKTQQKRSYIFHSEQRTEWSEQQYKLFLQGLYKNFEIVVNNKRIAKFMGDVNPNHVRFVKGFYLRNLKKRAKDRNINRKELLKEDIDNFDMALFEKIDKVEKVDKK